MSSSEDQFLHLLISPRQPRAATARPTLSYDRTMTYAIVLLRLLSSQVYFLDEISYFLK